MFWQRCVSRFLHAATMLRVLLVWRYKVDAKLSCVCVWFRCDIVPCRVLLHHCGCFVWGDASPRIATFPLAPRHAFVCWVVSSRVVWPETRLTVMQFPSIQPCRCVLVFVAASCWFDRASWSPGSRAMAQHQWRMIAEVDSVPRCYFGQPSCVGSQVTCKMLCSRGLFSCIGFCCRVQFALGST